MMPSDRACALVVSVVLMLLVVLSRRLFRGGKAIPLAAKSPRAKRDPNPFAGFTRMPDCPACAQEAESHPTAFTPNAPPPRMTCTRGRHRHVDTTGHFCPQATCAYHGWVGWGNIRANGHPNDRRWRQLLCLGCHGYFLETTGTPLHGKQVEPDKLVWAIAALAEGLGIRAVARVFETDPTTVLGWLVEAADHLEACSRHFLRDLDVEQVQMDELFAWLSAVKDGDVSDRQAITRLSRSPHWVWVAMDPVCKLILAVDVGDRTLAMAQRLVHQITQVLAPDCAPLFLTDGCREYFTAFVTHYGHRRPTKRSLLVRQAKLGALTRPLTCRRPTVSLRIHPTPQADAGQAERLGGVMALTCGEDFACVDPIRGPTPGAVLPAFIVTGIRASLLSRRVPTLDAHVSGHGHQHQSRRACDQCHIPRESRRSVGDNPAACR